MKTVRPLSAPPRRQQASTAPVLASGTAGASSDSARRIVRAHSSRTLRRLREQDEGQHAGDAVLPPAPVATLDTSVARRSTSSSTRGLRLSFASARTGATSSAGPATTERGGAEEDVDTLLQQLGGRDDMDDLSTVADYEGYAQQGALVHSNVERLNLDLTREHRQEVLGLSPKTRGLNSTVCECVAAMHGKSPPNASPNIHS